MTVETSISRSGPYAGAGTTGPFTVGFRFLDNTHLSVVRTDANGVDSVLVLGADYTVLGAGNPTGSVTLTTALAVGFKLTILRLVPKTQEANYVQNDDFPAESHEGALDKLTMITQELSEASDRSIKIGASDAALPALPPASGRTNTIIGFDGVGNLVLLPSAASIGAGDMRVDIFTAGVDFTSGITTQLTVSRAPGSQANAEIFFDSGFQGTDQWSVNGSVITFTSPIPVGVVKVFVRLGTTLSTLVPPNGSVSDASLAIGSAIHNRITHIYDPMDPQYGCKFDGVTDDAPGLNECFTDAANTGGVVMFPATGTAVINSPLLCKVTEQLDAALPGSSLYLSDMRTVTVWSPGRCTVKAGSAMTTMLTFTFNAALGNIGPYFSSVEGVVFDGNNLAVNGLLWEWTTRSRTERCTFANMSGHGASNLGYGVAQYLYNTFITKVGIRVQQGGDSLIDGNDFYAPAGSNGHIGIDMQGWSGNTHIHENTFTADATSVNEIPILLNANIPAQSGREVRDVTICDNEFSGYDLPISGVAASNNLYNCIIERNHKTAFGVKASAALLSLTGANQIILKNNIIGNDAYPTLTGNSVSLLNCARMTIGANKFTNLANTPIVLTNVVQSKVYDNEFYDYAKSDSSSPAIYIDSTSSENELYGNTYNQSNVAYGQFGVAEHAGCDNNYAHDEKFLGITQPYLVVGGNTRFVRSARLSSAPSSGYYNQGDLVINSAPTAVRNISHWRCVTSGNPAVFAAYGCGTGTTAQRPVLTANDLGYLYRDTTTGLLIFWDGSAWQAT